MRSRTIRTRVLAHLCWLLLAPLGPRILVAQDLSKVLGNVLTAVTDIDAAYIWGRPFGGASMSRDSTVSGLAVEATLFLATLGRSNCRPAPPDSVTSRGRTQRTQDTTLTEVRLHRRGSDGLDTVRVLSVTKATCTEEDPLVAFELGVGYSQMRGFRGDAFGVRGSLEELPLTSIYAVFNPSRTISPYVGVSGGLVQLKDFRANGYGDTLLTAAGSTFEYGGIVGAAVGPAHGRWSVFGEAKWTWRQFDGPTWSGGRVPPVLQSPLKLWTRTYTVGAQFRIATPKP